MKSETSPMQKGKEGMFEIQKAVVALKLLEKQANLLPYLNFFQSQVPLKSIDFVHVIPQFDAFHAFVDGQRAGFRNLVALNEAVHNEMKEAVENFFDVSEKGNCSFEIREGNPLEEMLAVSEKVNPDLNVIGQSSGSSRHGIMARKLASKTDSNALIVPDQAKAQLKKILVPIDFSPLSGKALQTAYAIAQQSDSKPEIHCINVYEMPDVNVYSIQKGHKQFKEMVESDRGTAFKRFTEKYLGTTEDIKLDLVEKMMPGIANYIYDFAKDNKSDLVIIGAKGHSKVEKLLLGSVTERLLTINDQIPTIIIK